MRAVLFAALSLISPAFGFADDLLVTNASDIVNGDTSSPAALASNPGPDGISIREAMLAADAVEGPHRVSLSASLVGTTIRLNDALPPIHRDGLALQGALTQDGTPAVRLDASGITGSQAPGVIYVIASHVSVRNLWIEATPLELRAAITVEAGPIQSSEVPTTIEDVLIEGNLLDNSMLLYPAGFAAKGIDLRGQPETNGLTLRDVTVRGNRLFGFRGDNDAIIAGIGGSGCAVENLSIEGNEIRDSTFGIEIGNHTGPGNRVSGVSIRGNRIFGGSGGIVVGTGGRSSSFEDLSIESNEITDAHAGVIVTVVDGPDVRMAGVRLLGNRAIGNQSVPILIQASGSGTTMEQVFLARNVFDERCGPCIQVGTAGGEETAIRGLTVSDNVLHGSLHIAPSGRFTEIEGVVIERNRTLDDGITVSGGDPEAQSNLVRSVRIVNNAVSGTVSVVGGIVTATGNRVEQVHVANNTIIAMGAPALRVLADAEGSHGNGVSGVDVVNTILESDSTDVEGDLAPSQVRSCITGQAGLVGVNGNFFADPLFVGAAEGDFHLSAGSPAIGNGSILGAPCVDFDGNARLLDGKVDIGAYEFGSVFSLRPCPVTSIPAPVLAPIVGRHD